MKVSINWLKDLVELNKPVENLIETLNLKTIGTKEVTDRFIELDMKGYNRADLLSMRGVAYESAAIMNSEVRFEEPDPGLYLWVKESFQSQDINIESEKLSPIYCLAKIEGLKVEQSPEDWKQKLTDSGFRSINNIADITNLLMLEYGQPMHAFDSDKVAGNVGVRLAKDGEEITTLDGKNRKLSKDDLLIVDENGPIGLAGVMGGKDSEISDSTTTVLLEAAIFDPVTLRRTATKLGLTSEASKRFYHGLTKKRLLQALNEALKMYKDLGGEVTRLTLIGDFEEDLPKIPVRLEKINSLVGVEFSKSQVEEYLSKLNFDLKEATEDSWVVTPPYYRLDVTIEEDVIEEVARMYGYEKIEPKALPGEKPEASDQKLFELIDKLRTQLVGLGLTEVQTYSFYSTAILNALGFDEEKKKTLIKISNPISAETEYLRQSIWANLEEAILKNEKLGMKDVALFEIGKDYMQVDGKVVENWALSIGLMNGTDNPISELISIFKKLDLPVEIKQIEPPEFAKPLVHPNRFLAIAKDGEEIGGISETHKRILDKLGIKGRVAVLEIFLEKLLS